MYALNAILVIILILKLHYVKNAKKIAHNVSMKIYVEFVWMVFIGKIIHVSGARMAVNYATKMVHALFAQ